MKFEYLCYFDNLRAPDISFKSVVPLLAQNLRRCIGKRSTAGLQQLDVVASGGKTKVSKLHIVVFVQQDVLAFEIPVKNSCIYACIYTGLLMDSLNWIYTLKPPR